MIDIWIVHSFFLTSQIISSNSQIRNYNVSYCLLFLVLSHTPLLIISLAQNHALFFTLSYLYSLNLSNLLFVLIRSKISMVSSYITYHLFQISSFHLRNCWISLSYDVTNFQMALLLYFLLYMSMLLLILLALVSIYPPSLLTYLLYLFFIVSFVILISHSLYSTSIFLSILLFTAFIIMLIFNLPLLLKTPVYSL